MNWRVTVWRHRPHSTTPRLMIWEEMHRAEFGTYQEAAKDEEWALRYYPCYIVGLKPLTEAAREQIRQLNKVAAPHIN